MKLVFVFILVLSTQLLDAQILEQAAPESVNISPKRLQKIDAYIQSAIDQKVIPGGVFLLARKGKLVYHKSFGNSQVNKAYEEDNIFRIASMTKAITTVAIMQLFDRGLLGLDDPLEWHLPAFAEMTVLDTFNEADSSYTTKPANNKITIRHLLTHTSGITYGESHPGKVQAVYGKFQMLGVGLSHSTWTTEEFIDRLAKVPLVFEPGEKFLYGLNMDVLGRVIEVVSGKSLSEYFQEEILLPIGMEDTFFHLPKAKHKRLVPVYKYSEEIYEVIKDGKLTQLIDYPLSQDHGLYAGGGGLSSTALDYAKFIQMLLNKGIYGGNRILNPHTIDLIKADQLISLNKLGKGFSEVPGLTYGLGFLVFTEEAEGFSIQSPGTYQWGGYFNTKFFIDPEEGLIFVGMTQIVGFQNNFFWDRLYAVMYGALED